MKRRRFTEERIIEILKEHEAGATVAEVCRKHGMSSATFYAWGATYRGMDVSEAKRLKALEAENAKLSASRTASGPGWSAAAAPARWRAGLRPSRAGRTRHPGWPAPR
jgi:putative transposase